MSARVMAAGMLAALAALACASAGAAEPPAAPSATPVKHYSLKSCNAQADAKKLNGAARSQFVKHCQAQTVSSSTAHTPAAAPTPAGK
jgi:hypothetical protein